MKNEFRKILLQNENGPCPLLAAANALLLRGVISLTPECIRNGVASIDDVVNVLADRAISSQQNSSEVPSAENFHHEFHLNEVLSLLPSLQHGMDINIKFTSGVKGVEYTNNLAAFDLLGVELVHGWLLDPQDVETMSVVGSKSYNELIEIVIIGNESDDAVQKLETQIGEKEKMLQESEQNVNSDCVEECSETVGDNAESLGRVSSSVASEDEASAEHDVAKTNPDDDVQKLETQAGKEGNMIEVPKQNETSDCAEKQPEITTDAIDDNAETTEMASRLVASAGEASENVAIANNAATSSEPSGIILEGTEVANPLRIMTDEEKNALRKEISGMKEKISEHAQYLSRSHVANAFLTSSSHQLTYHGLHEMHNHVGEDSLCVFFRNNHFATLTKHNGVLYLLVTDLGYANVPEVIWEKLDAINGDTEYANEFFEKPKPREELNAATGPTLAPELLLAQRSQAESDFQLALAMSEGRAPQRMDDDEGRLMDVAKELSLKSYHGEADAAVNVGSDNNCRSQEDADHEFALSLQRQQMQSEHDSEQVARQMQQLEYERQRTRNTRAPPTPKSEASSSNCIVM